MAIRHALRSLKRTPVFTITAILALVLGVASIGSMFAIVYGVLLAPLPYGAPDRLVSIALQSPDAGEIGQPPALYFTYRQFAESADDVAFYRTGSTNVWTAGADTAADSVVATWVTASMMPLLRVSPLLGRSFTAEEELRGGPDAVILSESEWRSRFAGAPDVIGRTLMVNSVPREVVGVMPARFAFPTADTRVWLPAKHIEGATVGDFMYSAVARLAPGATAAQAQRELATLLPRMAESFPSLASGSSTMTWLADAKPVPVVLPLREELTGGIAPTLWMLGAVAALVLLVAWTNVANLMLIRADGRAPELALRAALGASRMRIATHFLGESLLLGTAAGAVALLATHAAVRALVALGPADVPRLAELGIGLPTTGFIVSVTALGIVVCAAVPAGRLRRAGRPGNLREAGRGESAGKARLRLRAAITSLQIAVALVVALGSALLLRTAQRLSEVDPGFDASEVTTLRTQLPAASYDDASSVAFYARLIERVHRLPSVRAAGLTMKVPLESAATAAQAFRSDAAAPASSLPVTVVDAGYFGTMGIPLLAGRGFRHLGLQRGTDIVISRSAARTLFGDSSGAAAVGKQLTLAPSGPVYTIIGVAGDVRDRDLASEPSAMVYRPLAVRIDPTREPATRLNMAIVVRTGGPSGAVVTAIRHVVRELDPAVAIYNVGTMSGVVRASTARLSLTITLMTAAAAITLLLGTIGLYGVMAYMVALRTRELGVRVALGADARRIARLVAARGLVLTAGGVAAGFVLYAIAAPLLGAFLYGVTPTDPVTLVGATLVLVLTASFASWLPARRAARVDPMEALRAE